MCCFVKISLKHNIYNRHQSQSLVRVVVQLIGPWWPRIIANAGSLRQSNSSGALRRTLNGRSPRVASDLYGTMLPSSIPAVGHAFQVGVDAGELAAANVILPSAI